MTMIREQRILLLKRLDVLSAKLKVETDSMRADLVLEEMGNIGKLLRELVRSSVQDHKFEQDSSFKEYSKQGYERRLV